MLNLILHLIRGPLRCRESLILENVALRHQLQVLSRGRKRPALKNRDRMVWIFLRRAWQGWKTFLKNHSHEIVSVDFFTVPTITCQILYVFMMVENSTRRIVHFNVTAHPTMEWTSRQLVEAFPWDTVPTYILRDRDHIYGRVFTAMVEAMGIEDVPTAPRSPWQNPYIERLIGTVRRDCLDHVIVFNDRHLRRVLSDHVTYYNESRTHLGLEKECPVPRAVEPPEAGPIRKFPILGGLHHRYFREAA